MRRKILPALALCLALSGAAQAADQSWMQATPENSPHDSAWMTQRLKKDLKAPSDNVAVGTIMSWLANSMPADGKWLECNGQTVSATAYPEYVKKFGSKLPDFRGKFLRGYGDWSGPLGQVQKEQIGDHRHVVGQYSHWLGYHSGGWGGFTPVDQEGDDFMSQGTFKVEGSRETRPDNIAVKFIIKVK